MGTREEDLLRLNRDELQAKRYQEFFGEPFYYTKYLYLKKYDSSRISLEQLNSPQALMEQKELEQFFQSVVSNGRIPTDYFFPEGQNIAVEKVLRYVSIPLHSHDFIECVCTLHGNCRHIIGDTEYLQTEGMFAYLPSEVAHCTEPDPDCLCLSIKVRTTTFLNFHLPNMPYFSSPLVFRFGDDPMVHELLLNMYDQQEKRKIYGNQLLEKFFEILMIYLIQNYIDTLTFPSADAPIRKELLAMLNYMYENYQTVTLKSLAEEFHYNETYLSNFFHKHVGETFSETLKKYKLRRAEELLRTTKWKLEEICEAIGYKDTTQFIRNFREYYGETPGKYRKLHGQKTTD